MERLVKGDVIVINFPYSDLIHYKKRPSLIIKVPKGEDIIACQITGTSFESNVEISLNQEDFRQGSLNRQSFVRIDKIFSIEKSMIGYKAGSLKHEKINYILDKLCRYLKE